LHPKRGMLHSSTATQPLMLHRSALTHLLLVLALVTLGGPASAQQTTGSIAGVVVDDQGSAVPGATVTANNTGTGFTRTVTTNEAGLYQLAAVPVGSYQVVIELSGFTRVEVGGVTVNISATTDVNATLRVAQVAETVTVTAETPI